MKARTAGGRDIGLRALAIAAALMAVSSTAAAARFEEPPEAVPYVGAALLHNQVRHWSSASGEDSQAYTSRDTDNQDLGYQLCLGFDYPRFAVEASYADFGEVSFSGQSDGSGDTFGAGPIREVVQLAGPAVHALFRLPIAGDFSLVAKVGQSWVNAKGRLRGSRYHNGTGPAIPFSSGFSDRSGVVSFGAGVRYDGFHPLRLGADYTLVEPELNGMNAEQGVVAVSIKRLFGPRR